MEKQQFTCPRCDYSVDIPEDSAAEAKVYAANVEHMMKHLTQRTPRQNKLKPES